MTPRRRVLGFLAVGSLVVAVSGCSDDSTDTNNNTSPVCGNGAQEGSEECDEADLNDQTCQTQGFDGGTLVCFENCVFNMLGCYIFPPCGNGEVDTGEECDTDELGGVTCEDLGYASGTLACTIACLYDESGCVPEMLCGNGQLDPGEHCDDGNTDGGDGCGPTCQWELCGNDFLDVGEECDDGPDNSDVLPDACRTDCRLAYCGDVVVDTGEQCDDGNNQNGDGCSSSCTIE